MKTIKRILAGLMIVAVLVYAGACVVSNVTGNASAPKIPDATKAKYVFTFERTGKQVLANEYIVNKQKIIVLDKGYWDPSGNGFRFRRATLPLDPKIFGPIALGQREVQSAP
jgi:hypothetical protein